MATRPERRIPAQAAGGTAEVALLSRLEEVLRCGGGLWLETVYMNRCDIPRRLRTQQPLELLLCATAPCGVWTK